MTKIIMSGTFNPITNAHLDMIKLLHENYPDAKIEVRPASSRYFQSKWKSYPAGDVMPEWMRFTCCYAALINESITYAEVSNMDMYYFNKGTYDIMNITKAGSDDEYYICLGADNLEHIDTWRNADKLVAENKFIIISRNGEKGKLPEKYAEYTDHFTYIEGRFPNVSATQVREAYKEGRLDDVKDIIPACVYGYLKEEENVYF